MFADLVNIGAALLKLGMFALMVVAALRMTIIDIYVVEDNGMAPTLVMGDTVAVLTSASIDFADVVLCQNPEDNRRLVTGRVVALEGSTITHDRHRLVIDGDATECPSHGIKRFYDADRRRHQTMDVRMESFAGHHEHPIFIEQGQQFHMRKAYVNRGVFLLGDNRSDIGHDSRRFGAVDDRDCIGQVIMRLKPAPPRDDDVQGSYMDIID